MTKFKLVNNFLGIDSTKSKGNSANKTATHWAKLGKASRCRLVWTAKSQFDDKID